MYAQTIEEMIGYGASATEARQAAAIWKLLEPSLKVQPSNGRIMTAQGDKTTLGVLRSIVQVLEENK